MKQVFLCSSSLQAPGTLIHKWSPQACKQTEIVFLGSLSELCVHYGSDQLSLP